MGQTLELPTYAIKAKILWYLKQRESLAKVSLTVCNGHSGLLLSVCHALCMCREGSECKFLPLYTHFRSPFTKENLTVFVVGTSDVCLSFNNKSSLIN